MNSFSKAQPLQKVNLNTVRAAMKLSSYGDSDSSSKVTVIKRDGDIIVRLDDGGSCRNSELKSSMFATAVKCATGLDVVASTYNGQKNLYSYTWYEAKIVLPK
jgi:hypothetical protein